MLAISITSINNRTRKTPKSFQLGSLCFDRNEVLDDRENKIKSLERADYSNRVIGVFVV